MNSNSHQWGEPTKHPQHPSEVVICERLGISSQFLRLVNLRVLRGKAYERFNIPKFKGGMREIHSPRWDLALIQRRIKERILDHAPELPDCVMAFRRGRTICDNALPHCDKAVVVKFDLEDFFSSVSFSKVLASFKFLRFGEEEARLLANLTTVHLDGSQQTQAMRSLIKSAEKFHQTKRDEAGTKVLKKAIDEALLDVRNVPGNFAHFETLTVGDFRNAVKWATSAEWLISKTLCQGLSDAKGVVLQPAFRRRGLPQGAATSPQLANRAAIRIDFRLMGLAASLGFAYTRYADDLTFSSSDPMAKVDTLKSAVQEIVEDSGFRLNLRKTKIMRAPATRRVTGLIVNGGAPTVPRAMVRKIRAMLHQQGLGILPPEDDERLRGYLAFVRMVEPARADLICGISSGLS